MGSMRKSRLVRRENDRPCVLVCLLMSASEWMILTGKNLVAGSGSASASTEERERGRDGDWNDRREGYVRRRNLASTSSQ